MGRCDISDKPQKWNLILMRSSNGGNAATFELEEGSDQTIGRSQDRDISLPQCPYVSGEHARVRVEGGQLSICDNGSRNGTKVGDEPLEPSEAFSNPTVLEDGAVITLAPNTAEPVILRVRLAD